MAKAPKKTKKAAASSAKTKAKASPSAPAPNAPEKRNPMILPLMIGAILVGVVLGMMFSNSQGGGMTDAEFEAKVKTYIEQNADVVIKALNNHVREKQEASREQAINLVKANDGVTVLGNPDGDVTIYEFSDYNCGYCKRAFNDVMAAVEEDGNIRLVIKEFPILAESSTIAAQLSMAAGELGKFEEFHTALMQWPGRLDDNAFMQITADLGLDMNALATIIAKGEIDTALAETREVAQQLNLTGTPGFVIGDQIAPGYIPKEQILELVRIARES